MSLFIAGLAFHDEALVTDAKVGIFTASFGAAVAGWLLLRREKPCDVPEVPEEDEPGGQISVPAEVARTAAAER
jgi:hypothetical protein